MNNNSENHLLQWTGTLTPTINHHDTIRYRTDTVPKRGHEYTIKHTVIDFRLFLALRHVPILICSLITAHRNSA